MFKLPSSHCCATCRFSLTSSDGFESITHSDNRAFSKEADLFPLGQDLMCEYLQGSLEEDCVQAVLVRSDGRCEAYECHLERYIAVNGSAPREEEDFYGVEDEYLPTAAMGLRQDLRPSQDF